MVRSLAQGDIRSQDLSQVELPQSFGVVFSRPGAVQWCKATIYNRMLSDPIGRGHKVAVVIRFHRRNTETLQLQKYINSGPRPRPRPRP